MSSDEKPGNYKIGRGKPPQHSKWPKGTSGNPKGRPPKPRPDAASVVAILDAPIDVLKGGVPKKMPAFEASVRRLVSRAIGNGDIQAARMFLRLCDAYGVIDPALEPCNSFQVPSDWDWYEWMEMFWRFGPPPWPGERSGLTRDSELKAARRQR